MDRAEREMCSRDVLTGHINDFVVLFKQLLQSVTAQGAVSGLGALSLSGEFQSPSELAAQNTRDLFAQLLRKDELLQQAVHKRAPGSQVTPPSPPTLLADLRTVRGCLWSTVSWRR
jgi:hypothetical protein